MRIVSWNVNGIRSVLRKGFSEWLSQSEADIVCLQETKISERDLNEHIPAFPGYTSYWVSSERSGYGGVAILSRIAPLQIFRGLNRPDLDTEGRVITAEFETCFIVNVYVPNSQTGYVRLPYRLAWDEVLREYLDCLKQKKSVIICGDFNVAHTELDIGIPNALQFPGCSPEEQRSFDKLLSSGFVDSFRILHPETRSYSWWSYGEYARAWNQGIRFDYILTSPELISTYQTADTARDVPGSDHGPVSLTLNFDLGTSETIQTPILPSGQCGFSL